MAWDSVPWFTEGGAEHSSEVARLLAYAAFGGAEGIVGIGDLRVQALATPGAAVQVLTGACAIRNRAAGGQYQAYAARMPAAEQVPIPATGAAARSDLIIARIENPYSYGESWPNPSDPKVGPYVHTRVIPNVPKTTTSVRQVRPNDSAITLARVDLPANTSSVTQAMITDLREMVQPRRLRVVRYMHGLRNGGDAVGNIKNPAWEEFPEGCRWPIEIPEWATSATIIATWGQLAQRNAKDSYGYLRAAIGPRVTPLINFDCDWSGNTQRYTFVGGGTVSIPADLRGTVQNGVLQGSGNPSYTGELIADAGSGMIFDIEFVEDPRQDSV
jgi:hypothetical protein